MDKIREFLYSKSEGTEKDVTFHGAQKFAESIVRTNGPKDVHLVCLKKRNAKRKDLTEKFSFCLESVMLTVKT